MKLHELLAVETDLENQAVKCRTELASTFDKKRHHFAEKRVTFTPLAENAQSVTEDQNDIQTTVKQELEWLGKMLIKSYDASYQVAEANTAARGNVILEDDEGKTFLEAVPATALLELQKRLTELGQVITAIPTLDPAKGFKPDKDRQNNIYVAREVVKPRTRKTKKAYTKYEPRVELPNLPAQVELVDEDVPVGTIRELEWSGLISPADKSDLINRCEMMVRAVKRARARANETEVDRNKKVGAQIVTYILSGKK